jgi:hypothetical protein
MRFKQARITEVTLQGNDELFCGFCQTYHRIDELKSGTSFQHPFSLFCPIINKCVLLNREPN